MFRYVTQVRNLGTPQAIEYGNLYINEYTHLQEAQGRVEEDRSLLQRLNAPNLLDRYERAYKAYMAYSGGTGEKTEAGNEIRNLILGLSGELLERAKKWPKENMTWKIMAPGLAVDQGRGHHHITLIRQADIRSSLLNRLADVLKDREGETGTDLHTIWTETLDHIYVVLGLINLP
jgi:hypothetical protein